MGDDDDDSSFSTISEWTINLYIMQEMEISKHKIKSKGGIVV